MFRLLVEGFIYLVIPAYLIYVLYRLTIMKKVRFDWFVEIKRVIGLVYIVQLVYIVWLSPAPPFNYLMINIIPFHTIYEYSTHVMNGGIPVNIALLNIIGNILLLLPFGFLLPLFFRGLNWNRVLIIGLAAPIIIEAGQLSLYYMHLGSRSVDADDVILNFIGAVCGYALFCMVDKRTSYLKKFTGHDGLQQGEGGIHKA